MDYQNTYEGIDPEIIKIVKKTAKRAIGKAGLKNCDLPDIEQELMLAALKALERLQKDAEYERAFISRSINNRLKMIFRERNLKSKKWCRCCVSLNISVELDDGSMEELINFIDTEQMLRNDSCFFSDPYQNIDLAGNINSVIEKLPEKLQKLCEELKEKPVNEFICRKNMSRKNACREIKRLRKKLEKLEIILLS
jgi:DNA-directed RNA polymerase specialized sigma24 family protein